MKSSIDNISWLCLGVSTGTARRVAATPLAYSLGAVHTFIERMHPERQAAMMAFVAQRETHAPALGTEAPDFTLPRLGSDEWVQLTSFRHHQPVALIFGKLFLTPIPGPRLAA